MSWKESLIILLLLQGMSVLSFGVRDEWEVWSKDSPYNEQSRMYRYIPRYLQVNRLQGRHGAVYKERLDSEHQWYSL